MSEFKQTIEYTFSRVKNGLAELQRWWPVYIKNLGNSAGISVDPILFKSYFGPPCKASAHSLRPPGGAMIAETGTVPQTTYTPDNRWNLGDNETGSVSQPGPQDTEGPYPVFMTIQELAEWLDTYRHIGVADDSNKRAWLPHGLIGNSATGITGTSALPTVNADPRLTAGDSAFPTTSITTKWVL
jgi:hypothetical protein